MNCKQGDLAIVVATHPLRTEYLGLIVKIVKWVDEINKWETDFITKNGKILCGEDWGFRPIRDSDKEDEMLRLIGKPENRKLTA